MSQGIPVNQVNQVNGGNAVNRGIPLPTAMRQQLQQQQLQAHVQQQQQQQQQQNHHHQAGVTGLPQQQQSTQHLTQAQAAAAQQQQAQAQRQMTPQQLQKQRHQLLFQKLKNYKFAETSEDILKKYSHLPHSLEFHIYQNHFRFGQQDGIIPKSSPLGKEFIKCILREEIPDSMVEVIKDSRIQLHEGCVILNMVDHRHMVDKIVKQENAAGNGVQKTIKTPKVYKTVLRPSQMSIYADLLYQTDSAQLRLSDQSSLLLEAEILTLTKRNVQLGVPLNPYKCDEYLRPSDPVTKYDAENDRVIHQHRSIAGGDDEPHRFKPLHEDTIVTHHDQNEYEDMMSLFSDNNKSIGAGANMMADSSSTNSSRFLRLRFIENYRTKLERMKAAGLATNLQNKIGGGAGDFNNANNGGTPNGLGSVPNMLGLTPQQRLAIQQQRVIQQQQKLQMSNALNGSRANSNTNSGNNNNNNNVNNNNNNTSSANASGGGSAAATPAPNEKKKPATKRPRKQPTKKQQAAAAAAAAAAGSGGVNLNESSTSTPEGAEPPAKKKRGAYKKKAKNADAQQQQQPPTSQPQQQQQQQQQQAQPVPAQQQQQQPPTSQPQQAMANNNFMDMNFNMMGNFPQ